MVNDIIVISIYAPRTYDIIDNENINVSDGYKHEFRFALGMCISNLLLKPFSIFFIYREYCKTSVTD
ncbi:type-1 angiotensin ii receptor-associated protein-like isoform x3 [Plakobranchus ocellatus]|uniref:Type-1 angiotensin ii receptor-associated protein-like isoform x3 n=1 Tax=Plakobranchus ocellatus TaxID=259542 RepID=A0AAV4DMK8_9GAST|nr:type-1 angiotensin ii receptor-associated protein-like isoform x3 [Plakobranchus ocellatus]